MDKKEYATPTMDFRLVRRTDPQCGLPVINADRPGPHLTGFNFQKGQTEYIVLQQQWVIYAHGPNEFGQTIDRLEWRDVPVVEEKN
jgi:hypothetical protein